MNGILLLIPLSVALGATFVALFLRAAREGQFDDLDEEARRIFADDVLPPSGPGEGGR